MHDNLNCFSYYSFKSTISWYKTVNVNRTLVGGIILIHLSFEIVPDNSSVTNQLMEQWLSLSLRVFSVNDQKKMDEEMNFWFTFFIVYILYNTKQILELNSLSCWCDLTPLSYYNKFTNFFFIIPDVLISRSSIQRVLDVSSEWTEDQNDSAQSTVQYAFRVTCDAHYYGDRCANLCRPREDNFGHYTCSSTGERICLSGWEGDYCDKGEFRKVFFCFYFQISIIICLDKRIRKLNFFFSCLFNLWYMQEQQPKNKSLIHKIYNNEAYH